jgi:hypothetical protein
MGGAGEPTRGVNGKPLASLGQLSQTEPDS